MIAPRSWEGFEATDDDHIECLVIDMKKRPRKRVGMVTTQVQCGIEHHDVLHGLSMSKCWFEA